MSGPKIDVEMPSTFPRSAARFKVHGTDLKCSQTHTVKLQLIAAVMLDTFIYYRISMCLYCSICLLLQFILESQKCVPSRSDCQCAPSTARCFSSSSSSSLSPLWSSLSPPISSLISSCPSPLISPQSLPPSGAVAYFPPWMSVCAIYSVHRITGSWINYNRTQ